MPIIDLTSDWTEIEPEELILPQAKEFMAAACQLPWFKFYSVSRDPQGNEIVHIRIDVAVGQKRKKDIKFIEPIAIRCFANNNRLPEVLAMRHGFPRVMHTNLEVYDYPISLCIYIDSTTEVKLTWTPQKMLKDVKNWLEQTSKQKLHTENQPLEPFLFSGSTYLILPFDFESQWEKEIIVRETKTEDKRISLIAEYQGYKSKLVENRPITHRLVVIQTNSVVHGAIHKNPQTLADLVALGRSLGVDIIEKLQNFTSYYRSTLEIEARKCILLLRIPKQRVMDGPIESTESKAFEIKVDLLTLAIQHLKSLSRAPDSNIIVDDYSTQFQAIIVSGLEDINVEPLNPIDAFTQEMAQKANGNQASQLNITAIGMGAIGSQILNNLIRAGFGGAWDVIDKDVILPHNLARHTVLNTAIGFPKADEMCSFGLNIREDLKIRPLVIDIFYILDQHPDIFNPIDYIFDFSASVAVSRALSCDLNKKAPRISAFVNPTGTDSIILAEGQHRSIPLDCLEMQYYRFLINKPKMKGHLIIAGRHIYANSCRDVSSQIPQHFIALHSAIIASELPLLTTSGQATIQIHRTGQGRERVTSYFPTIYPMIEQEESGWKIKTDEAVLEKAFNFRKKKLPNETGGVVLGNWDTQRKILYIADLLPAPKDSTETPTSFERGKEGLQERMQSIIEETSGQLQRIGEWHSHPSSSCEMSNLDKGVMSFIESHFHPLGFPAFMLIVGDNSQRSFHLSCP